MRVEEEIFKKVEETLIREDVKSEMQTRIEEGNNKLMDNITLQRQKDEEKVQGHQRIFEEVELQCK
jgi:hypothetical protein